MRTYDVKCPICGKVNRGLYLEETEGWMECDQCRNATKEDWVSGTRKNSGSPFTIRIKWN